MVDRWAVRYNPSGGSVSLSNNILTLTSANNILIIGERFEENVGFSGKTLTASILLSDGTIYHGTGVFPNKNDSDSNVIDTDNLTVYYQYSSASSNYPFLGIVCKANKTISIKAVKLELGSVSTLAMDIAPNYTTELLKCQRYFVRYGTVASGDYGFSFSGYGVSDSVGRVTITLPTKMRIDPSISFSSGTDDFQIKANGASVSANIATNENSQQANIIRINVTPKSTITMANYPFELRFNTATAYIDFSADL